MTPAADDEPLASASSAGQTPVDGERSQSVTIAGHPIHWFEYGEGNRVLLLLHGLSGSSRWWMRNIPDLARRYRVIVPDLIGFGRSHNRWRVPPLDQAAQVLEEWIVELGLSELVLIGHSMGGQIAIHLAAAQPAWLERLALVDAAGIPRALSPGKMIRLAAESTPVWRWGDPRFLRTIASDAWTAGPLVLARSVWNILRDDIRPLLPRIQVPTLIVWGERDKLVPLKDAWKLRDDIPNARLAVLRGAAHNPMVDRPADFNRILSRFVDGESIGR